ncbi:MAG: hypothetical protein EU542_04735 [Promethearchaeota archaeon]|nr:MAG: hypothetical protein EU542_04735 [Candidatus Lokiarchaeota archaeon]
MSDNLTPKIILSEVKKGKLSKSDATELLISLIDGSDINEIRQQAVEVIQKLEQKNEKIFKVLEHCLVSDKSALVRHAAARAIIHNFLKEGFDSLLWSINHDKSPLVINAIHDHFKEFNDDRKEFLKNKLNEWIDEFANDIGVVPEESKFFLDLEAAFAKNNEKYETDTSTYDLVQKITDYKTGQPWLAFEEGHVIILQFNYFNWNYLKQNKDHVSSIFKLSHPDLFLNSIQTLHISNNNRFKIPESISALIRLKTLNLSRNHLHEIPESLGDLSSLEQLDLSHNNIKEIPDSLINLKSLTLLKLKDNEIQDIQDPLLSFLNSIENFKI